MPAWLKHVTKVQIEMRSLSTDGAIVILVLIINVKYCRAQVNCLGDACNAELGGQL